MLKVPHGSGARLPNQLACSSPAPALSSAMASAADIAAALRATLQPILAELTKAITNQKGSSMVDTRGIGKPPSFDGTEKNWREWRGKMTAYLYASDPGAETSLKWVEAQSGPITDTLIADQTVDGEGRCSEKEYQAGQALNKKLYLILSDTCKGEPYRMVESAGFGHGFEAWRVLMRRYASKTPGTKRALLQNLFSLKPAASPETLETTVLNMEEMIRRYDGMAQQHMSEDIKCAILVACCPKELKEYLDMSSEEFVYTELRNKVTTWMERKRDQLPRNLQAMEDRNNNKPTPMDVGYAQGPQWGSSLWSYTDVDAMQEWGGYPEGPYHEPCWQEGETNYIPKGKGKGKGKSMSFNSWGKGASTWNPAKGVGKSKGVAKGEPKGQGKGTFQGFCHWCGKWGHPARLCQQKTAYMNEQRRLHDTTAQVEQEDTNKEDVYEMACTGNSRDLENFEFDRRSSTWEATSAGNRFAALCCEDDEEDTISYLQEFPRPEEGTPTPSGCTKPRMPRMPNVTQKAWRKRASQLPVISEVEVSALDTEPRVELTIDSGAAEHVVGPGQLPHVKVRPSPAGADGVTYVMANGSRTANQGEQHIKAITDVGHTCTFRAQVTNVKRPLMSVSRICDGGNRVVFESGGGYIQNKTSGVKIPFKRDRNVYRLSVTVPRTGFARQGQ